jgi:hypothetical protein
MAGRIATLSAALLSAALVAGLAAAGPASVRLRIAPASIKRGQALSIAVGVSPAGVVCRGSAEAAAGARLLAPRRAVRGFASWVFRTTGSTALGRWDVGVACGAAGTARGHFTVRRAAPPAPAPPPVVPARVVVEKSGFSTELPLGPGDDTFAGYGLVLHNVSPDEDAVGVEILLNFVDAGGLILDSATANLHAIPAGATYYFGGLATFRGTPATMQVVSVRISTRQKKSIPGLPPVSNLRVVEDFQTEVLGELANPYSRTLSDIARITVVCFDGVGNVIGGGDTFPPAALPPGARAAFSVTVYGPPASRVASVQASVEPELE